MSNQCELPPLSPELAQHACRVKDVLSEIECVQVRWSIFAVNGLFQAFLKDNKSVFREDIIVIDAELELATVDVPVQGPEELNTFRGRTVIGCSLYRQPHGNFGNVITALRNDPSIPMQKPTGDRTSPKITKPLLFA